MNDSEAEPSKRLPTFFLEVGTMLYLTATVSVLLNVFLIFLLSEIVFPQIFSYGPESFGERTLVLLPKIVRIAVGMGIYSFIFLCIGMFLRTRVEEETIHRSTKVMLWLNVLLMIIFVVRAGSLYRIVFFT